MLVALGFAEQMTGAPLIISQKIDSSPEAVRRALLGIRQALVQRDHPAKDDFGWETLLAEILNNIVEHAYAEEAGHEIQADFEFTHSRLAATIHDTGRPMPAGNLPSGAGVSPEDLPEGGFGWFLIHELAERLDYSREDGRNLLQLEMTVGNSPHSP